MHTRTHVRTHTHAHTGIHTHTDTHTHAHTDTHTCTHARLSQELWTGVKAEPYLLRKSDARGALDEMLRELQSLLQVLK